MAWDDPRKLLVVSGSGPGGAGEGGPWAPASLPAQVRLGFGGASRLTPRLAAFLRGYPYPQSSFSAGRCPGSLPIAVTLEQGIEAFLLLNRSQGITGVCQSPCRGTQSGADGWCWPSRALQLLGLQFESS